MASADDIVRQPRTLRRTPRCFLAPSGFSRSQHFCAILQPRCRTGQPQSPSRLHFAAHVSRSRCFHKMRQPRSFHILYASQAELFCSESFFSRMFSPCRHLVRSSQRIFRQPGISEPMDDIEDDYRPP